MYQPASNSQTLLAPTGSKKTDHGKEEPQRWLANTCQFEQLPAQTVPQGSFSYIWEFCIMLFAVSVYRPPTHKSNEVAFVLCFQV